MSPETRCRNIISSYNNDSSYLEPVILQQYYVMSCEIFHGTIHATYVFMIACYPKNAIGGPETTNIAPEIAAYNGIELSIDDISGEEYQIRLESIYFFDDSLDVIHAIGWSEVYIRCYCYFETSCDFIFFLYFELISAYFGISGVYVTESDGYYGPQHCEICEVVANRIYLFF